MNKSKKWATILTIIATNSLVISLFAATATLYSTPKVVRRLENTAGAQKAKEIALNHVNLKSEDVLFTKAQLDKDDNIPVYEVEFYHNNIEYDFEIVASTGEIKDFETEEHTSNIMGTITKPNVIIPNVNKPNITIPNINGSSTSNTNNSNTSASTTNNAQNTIGAQKAKEISLNHANLSLDKVLFKKAKLHKNNHVLVYDIEFITDSTKYEYEINAYNGQIKSFKTKKDYSNITSGVTTSTQTISAQKAKDVALNHANLSQDDVFFKKAKLDKDDHILVYDIEFIANNTKYEYEINAYTGQINEFKTKSNLSNNTDVATSPNDSSSSDDANTNIDTSSNISIEQAKQIALNHANLSPDNVFFKKAKLDHDDGMQIYELEFYSNNVEYDYEINASNGTILEFDIDED